MNKKELSNYNNFISIYNLLNDHNKQIVFQTLFLMEQKRNYRHPSVNKKIYKKIETKKSSMNIGYTDLYNKICDINGYKISPKTYESVIHRKTISNDTFEDICKILRISKEELTRITIQTESQDQSNIKWLFSSLTSQNKNAIYHLVNLLYVEETFPEYFDDIY